MKPLMLSALLLASSSAIAAEGDVDNAVAGAGLASCGEYIEATTKPGMPMIFVSWAQGFLSGLNFAYAGAGKNFVALPDHQSIRLYLDNYCRSNPLKSPRDATLELFKDLHKR